MWLSFGAYDRKARLAPAIILALPPGVTVFAFFHGESLDWPVATSAGFSAALIAALWVLFASIARNMGKRRERELWDSWGGNPTVDLLRHRNEDLSPITRQGYLDCVAALLSTPMAAPTEEEEKRDPKRADTYYQAAVDKLISLTRDQTRFPLIFEENRNYGFNRNLWGLKRAGVLTTLLSTTAALALLFLEWDITRTLSAPSTVAFLFDLVMLLLWLFVVTSAWVRVPALAYARVLLASCGELCSGTSAQANSKRDS